MIKLFVLLFLVSCNNASKFQENTCYRKEYYGNTIFKVIKVYENGGFDTLQIAHRELSEVTYLTEDFEVEEIDCQIFDRELNKFTEGKKT